MNSRKSPTTLSQDEKNTIIDRTEGDWYIGRTEASSPEIDPEVLIPLSENLQVGEFYNIHITDATEFDLYGEVK